MARGPLSRAERLDELVSASGGYGEASTFLGVPEDELRATLEAGKARALDPLRRLARKEGFNLDWLLHGTEPKLDGGKRAQESIERDESALRSALEMQTRVAPVERELCSRLEKVYRARGITLSYDEVAKLGADTVEWMVDLLEAGGDRDDLVELAAQSHDLALVAGRAKFAPAPEAPGSPRKP